MSINEAFANLPPEHEPIDPSLPYFKYKPEERSEKLKALIAKGIGAEDADRQITKEEIAKTNIMAQDQFEEEQRKAA